jgi:2,3-bisphosphoglycerate-independent phosphoglycerate mutase
MFRYERDFYNPVLFEKKIVENTLGEKIEDAGLSQLRITESQKIPHVTYFFNGQRELEFEHEERRFVESDKIKAYDQKPEMHADDITDELVDAVENEDFDFILINFPNGDLVGHTGDLEASVKAVEKVDENVGRIVETAQENDYNVLLTSDHGNCENMGSEDSPNTSHTLNRVPAIGVGFEPEFEEEEIWEVENVIEEILLK